MNNIKKQKHIILKDEPPRLVDVQYATEKNRQIASEGMKRLSQSTSRAQLRMSLVLKVKSDAVKNNIV